MRPRRRTVVADVQRTAAVAAVLSFAATAGVLLAASPAVACASCLSGSAQARWAYYATTVLLMLLPFAIAGLAVWWLRRAGRDEASRSEARDVGERSPATR